jgi:triacylglycerol esterase/lipase EstA (alpha/beta hydrolase family)
MYAFPNGLPNFENTKKIHFIGHSMGALTARYLTHLLEIGYFDEIAGIDKTNRSYLIASITCLSGANNGSLVINNCGMRYND